MGFSDSRQTIALSVRNFIYSKTNQHRSTDSWNTRRFRIYWSAESHNSFNDISNCIELHSFCTWKHRISSSSLVPLSFAISICMKSSLLSSLSQWNNFVKSVYLRIFYCRQRPSNHRGPDNSQRFCFSMSVIVTFPTPCIFLFFSF